MSNYILHLLPIVVPITIVEPPRAGSAASVLEIVVGRAGSSFRDHKLGGDVGAGNARVKIDLYVSGSAASGSATSGSATTTEIIGDGIASRGRRGGTSTAGVALAGHGTADGGGNDDGDQEEGAEDVPLLVGARSSPDGALLVCLDCYLLRGLLLVFL